MAKIVRYSVLEEEHIGDNVFLCHRPYPFGNPFIVKDKKSKFKGLVKVNDLTECLNMYSMYFDRCIESDERFMKEWERLLNAFNNFDIIYLGCYCTLDKPCHTDIIKRKIEQHFIKEKIQEIIKNKKII